MIPPESYFVFTCAKYIPAEIFIGTEIYLAQEFNMNGEK